MPEEIHVIAGRCLTRYLEAETPTRERLGDAVVLCKPDDTVLVHDADAYQPVAWLTRADTVSIGDDDITAKDGTRVLRVTLLDRYGGGAFPVGRAGQPVDDCPDCRSPLVREQGAISCVDCDTSYPIPSDGTLLERTCDACGLPQFRVTRGETFALCLDRDCESLDERVTAAFDGVWDCPDCGDDLRVLRRGGLILGCAGYPACETGFSFPAGEVVDTCRCGLPIFEVDGGRRCLDTACPESAAVTPEGI